MGALVVLALLIPPPGLASPFGSASASPYQGNITEGGVVPVSFILNSTGFNLSNRFWGTTVTPRTELLDNETALVSATPARVIVWPGAAAGDQYDPIPTSLNVSINPTTGTASVTGNSSGPTLLNNPGGTSNPSAATEAQFVAFCESINCTAILQVPGEVNNTLLAQQVVYYTEHVLNFTPAAWEVGNEPELWKYWNCPWADWTKSLCDTHNNNVGHNNKLITPPEYADEVQNYTEALRLVDPAIQIIGLPGTGRPENHLSVTDWVNATVEVNLLNPNGSPNPNFAGVAFHDYPGGKFGIPTLPQFYATIASTAGLPARVESVRNAVQNITTLSCGHVACEPVPVYVTEVGSALSHWNYSQFSVGFPGALDLAAQVVQSMTLNLTNLDLYATVFNTTNSWFSPSTLLARPDYTLYSAVLPHLGGLVYPVRLEPPNSPPYSGSNSTLDSNLYAIATVAEERENRSDLLALNLNTTTSVEFTPKLPGIGNGVPAEAWYWNGTLATLNGNLTSVATTSAPVGQYFPEGLPQNFTLSNQSIVLFEAYPAPGGVPVAFPAVGFPAPTRWFLRVDGELLTSNGTNSIMTFLPPGSYPVTGLPIPLPLNGREKFPVERLEPYLARPLVVESPAVTDNITFATQWAVRLASEPEGAGRVAPGGGWLNRSAPATIVATPSSGFAFSRWEGYSPMGGSYSGPNSTATITPMGPISETAVFVPGALVSFDENGLPAGTSWNVTLTHGDLTNSSTNPFLTFDLAQRNWSFNVGPIAGYRAAPNWGNFTVADQPLAVQINFTPFLSELVWNETGLGDSPHWGVWVNGVPYRSKGAWTTANVSNGTYDYQVYGPAGYTITPDSGVLSVVGAPIRTVVQFVPTPYPVSFSESGLPGGTTWSVVILQDNRTNTSTGATLTFTLSDRNWTYAVAPEPGFRANPARANFTVNGLPVSIQIVFTAVLYRVIWNETGLGDSPDWGVVANGATYHSNSSWTVARLSNGTVNYQVFGPAGYSFSPASSVLSVVGAPTGASVRFVPLSYRVDFIAAGLPVGLAWGVQLGNLSQNSTASIEEFQIHDARYHYSIGAPPGYFATPREGMLNVTDRPYSLQISFLPMTDPPVVPSVWNLGGAAAKEVAIMTVAGWCAFAALAALHRRRPEPGSDRPLEQEPPQ
ncbi:MAG TPA: hypothetical protein VK424_06435 [Thermoplasmata archaeon]|nr:hypothetical protein [Thermoplasmata archaeon]